jgi:hypothetical protein
VAMTALATFPGSHSLRLRIRFQEKVLSTIRGHLPSPASFAASCWLFLCGSSDYIRGIGPGIIYLLGRIDL